MIWIKYLTSNYANCILISKAYKQKIYSTEDTLNDILSNFRLAYIDDIIDSSDYSICYDMFRSMLPLRRILIDEIFHVLNSSIRESIIMFDLIKDDEVIKKYIRQNFNSRVSIDVMRLFVKYNLLDITNPLTVSTLIANGIATDIRITEDDIVRHLTSTFNFPKFNDMLPLLEKYSIILNINVFRLIIPNVDNCDKYFQYIITHYDVNRDDVIRLFTFTDVLMFKLIDHYKYNRLNRYNLLKHVVDNFEYVMYMYNNMLDFPNAKERTYVLSNSNTKTYRRLVEIDF